MLATFLAGAAQAPAAKSVAGALDAQAALTAFDARNRTVRDFSGTFTQTYRSGALGRALVETGTVKVKRPSRMLFEYEKPEKKLFVADGDSYYFYVPRDKQVMIQNQKGDTRATARILAEGHLLEHFDCTGEETDPLGRKFLLSPKNGEKDANVKSIAIVLDASLKLLALEIQNAEGSSSRMVFSAFKENVGLKDSEFRFDVPKGVEVIS